ncbi:hypothetical protein Q8A67_001979 [Cirrhinus molitorella]|uniref:Plac8 onzin related protein 2 n=1 Tax=Cirrhinus molitorella TaxID=172907 RepID=A0AA88QGT8_9TELE|nr:hypothetical protein Q8A67_001979 [Cirrhinus molitorella]
MRLFEANEISDSYYERRENDDNIHKSSICCFAFWCFPCFACATARKHGECLCLPLLDGFGFIPPITTAMRVSVRNRYGIQDTICNDCLYSTFCVVCSWCQMSREMKLREQNITLVHSRAH